MITPWNFPVAIPSWKIFPALLAGNGVVIKPSEHAPACCEAFVAACIEAGVPADLVQVVHGFVEPAAALAVHPGVQAVSFTGSVPTGRKVAAAAMETGPRLVSLELGRQERHGRAARRRPRPGRRRRHLRGVRHLGPALHVDLAADQSIPTWPASSSTGSSSGPASCVLGDPPDPAIDVGPVITASSAERIDAMVAAAVDEGAAVACGGRAVDVAGCGGGASTPRRCSPACGPTTASPARRCSGPVLAVLEVADLDDAVDVVNSVEYGLSAAIYTRDINAALRAVDRIDTGIVYVNAPTIGAEIPLPFGGTKHTGNGFREAGTRGIEQFSQLKTVYVDYSGRLQKAQIDTHPLDGAGVTTPADTSAPATSPVTVTSRHHRRLAGPRPRRPGRGAAPLLRRGRRAGRGLVAHRRRRPALPRPRAPASPSTPPATATPGWSTPSWSRRGRCCTRRSSCTTPATSSWPSASARCARSSTSRRCSSATRGPRRSTAL